MHIAAAYAWRQLSGAGPIRSRPAGGTAYAAYEMNKGNSRAGLAEGNAGEGNYPAYLGRITGACGFFICIAVIIAWPFINTTAYVTIKMKVNK